MFCKDFFFLINKIQKNEWVKCLKTIQKGRCRSFFGGGVVEEIKRLFNNKNNGITSVEARPSYDTLTHQGGPYGDLIYRTFSNVAIAAQPVQCAPKMELTMQTVPNTTRDPAAKTSPLSAVAKLLQQYRMDPDLSRPPTMREYMMRIHRLPRLTGAAYAENGFSDAGDLSNTNTRLISGMLSAKMLRQSFKDELDKPVSIIREMQLICFEAKPRPISLALGGYTASDLIAYIYQDIARKHLDVGEDISRYHFADIVEDIKSWLRIPSSTSSVNTPQRHIRRRLMVMLDRTTHQASALIQDREMPFETVSLVQKLLERDDDQGYTRGDLRDFESVRNDLNLLAEHCILGRFEPNSRQVQDFRMVCCPSLVVDFAAYTVQRPRGRPRSLGVKVKKTRTVKANAATTEIMDVPPVLSKKRPKAAPSAQDNRPNVITDPLAVLEALVTN